MNRKELIKKYLDFFKRKGHKEIPNVSLIPKNDPTVLFTTAGMHPLVPYILGQPHPLGKRLANVQRCIRTVDIEDVGDSVHHTFFEMLGNWSLGDYWKKEAINFSFEFFTKILKIPKEKLAISCFKGDPNLKIPRDTESAKIWRELGITEERIAFLGKEDNWWGPAGKTGPCGPDTEIFYWKGLGKNRETPKKFNPKDKNWVEIGNNVFMEYIKNEKGSYITASQRNVDFGGGVERIISALNKLEDDYLIDCFKGIIKKTEDLTAKKYKNYQKEMRIIADHIKASVFIISDGISPSNKEQGYILRRLIRRAIVNMNKLGVKKNFEISEIGEKVIEVYKDYSNLQKNKIQILNELKKEEKKFLETLERGLNLFNKLAKNKKIISGKNAFLLYQSYGFPIEMTEELAKEKKIKIDIEDFKKEQKKHQELSKTAAKGKFKSGLADHSESTTKLHTAAHLLLSSLRKVLKNENIIQKGSNITPERLRLDFSFPRKLTESEIKQTEKLVNDKIKESIDVIKEEMPLEEAKKRGALGIFQEKYGKKVFVYSINNFSKEICAGPHIKNTKELGHFKIIKEESSSSGVRRIKAVLE